MIVVAALAAMASVSMGLAVSAAINSPNKAIPLVPGLLMVEVLLSSGWAGLSGVPALHQLSDVTSLRWAVQGFEATSRGDSSAWLASVVALTLLTIAGLVAAAVFTRGTTTGPRFGWLVHSRRYLAPVGVGAVLLVASTTVVQTLHTSPMQTAPAVGATAINPVVITAGGQLQIVQDLARAGGQSRP
jgi:hypothetical protein